MTNSSKKMNITKQCTFCIESIQSAAKTCAHCGQPQPPPRWKQRKNIKIGSTFTEPLHRFEWASEWVAYWLHSLALFNIIDLLTRLSIIVVIVLYIYEAPARTQQRHNTAWQIVYASQPVQGGQSAINALQDLNKEKIDLSGIHLQNYSLPGIALPNATLTHINLSLADLSGADLSGADLSGADLSGAILNGANLSGADFIGAGLSGAKLSGAKLREAGISGADLSGAILIGADLSGAGLIGADLSEANLSGVKYNDTTEWPTDFDPTTAGAINTDTQ